jgi:glycine cleavage system H protein
VGDTVTAGQSFGTVESVKAVSDLFSPVTGTVKEVNGELANSPEKINSDAHGSWMIKVELSDLGQLNELLSSADYDKYIEERSDH